MQRLSCPSCRASRSRSSPPRTEHESKAPAQTLATGFLFSKGPFTCPRISDSAETEPAMDMDMDMEMKHACLCHSWARVFESDMRTVQYFVPRFSSKKVQKNCWCNGDAYTDFAACGCAILYLTPPAPAATLFATDLLEYQTGGKLSSCYPDRNSLTKNIAQVPFPISHARLTCSALSGMV